MLRTVNTLLIFSFILQFLTVVLAVGFKNYILWPAHSLNGFLFFALAIAHITLNFGWIKKNIFGKK